MTAGSTVLVFGFCNTIAHEIASHLAELADVLYIESSALAIKELVEQVSSENYYQIIGIGQYSGRDQENIRIETHCTSQFRNNKANLRTLPIPYQYAPVPPFKLANGIGTSWCNLVSYEILRASPGARYTFLHVPKEYGAEAAVTAISEQLKTLR